MTQPKTDTTQISDQSTDQVFAAYNSLGTDEKLAFLYYVYKAMGDSITPAAPNAADPDLSGNLVTELYSLSKDEQLEAMRSIVGRTDSRLSRLYGGLASKNQLFVWYAWAKEMGDRVVDMPKGYQASDDVKEVLSQLKEVDFESQISFLKEAASQMGYSDIQNPPSQSETGKTASL
ncbi:orange carotenoid protein [filamentous cyanobacterium CCP5]|nr:orange carotenoid protein [filamentous cyanobacterium CCP5]